MFTLGARKLHTGEYYLLAILFALVIGLMFVFGYWIHVGYAIIITCMVCSLITASIVGSHEKRTPDRGVEEKWIDSEYLSDFAPT